jgi:transcriptional regulator with XRE-family HTH domain
MTQEEIAEELGISRQAVGKAIANGAEAMRKRLEARGITRTLDIFPERGQTAQEMMQPSRPRTDDESDSEVIDPREGDRMREAEGEQDLGSQSIINQTDSATFDTVTPEQDRAELGRAQPDEALVLTPTGWYQIGALLVGDQILDEQGNPQTVEAIYDQGTIPVFRITTETGLSTEASADHLWQTEQDDAEGNVITTTDNLAPGIRIPVAALA